MQNVRASGNLDKYENKASRYGAWEIFRQSTDSAMGIITQDLIEKARMSFGQTFETPVIDYDGTITVGNVRQAVIADSENTSAMHAITFATYAWGFTQVPAMFMNNEISQQRDWQTKFIKYLHKFASDLDTASITALTADKTQVFANALGYTVTGNVVQVPFADREKIMGDINVMMEANDFFSDMHLLGNGGVQSIINQLRQQGVYNAQNRQLEYLDKMVHYSVRLADGLGEFGNMIAVEDGSVGVLTRTEREAELGTVMADGTEWSVENLPILDIPVGTYYYQSRGDQSAIAGAATADLTRGMKEHYGFAVDVALVTPYNSDATTLANPILQAAVLDAV